MFFLDKIVFVQKVQSSIQSLLKKELSFSLIHLVYPVKTAF